MLGIIHNAFWKSSSTFKEQLQVLYMTTKQYRRMIASKPFLGFQYIMNHILWYSVSTLHLLQQCWRASKRYTRLSVFYPAHRVHLSRRTCTGQDVALRMRWILWFSVHYTSGIESPYPTDTSVCYIAQWVQEDCLPMIALFLSHPLTFSFHQDIVFP